MRGSAPGGSIAAMLLTTPAYDPAPLRAAMTGQVVTPGDAGWDEARQAWNLAVDQHPALIAIPESIADVQAAVNYARERGIAVAVQGTGHAAGAIAAMDGAMLIRTHKLRGVKIDPVARRAIVRAGDLWEDVTGPASEHGLAPLAGSSPDVGVVGYTLGGGISWLGRKFGLAANSVTAIAAVLADGRLVRCDREHEPELFWALRGGGGALGVVVCVEMELHPVPELVAGALFFPWERTAEVGHAWREWIGTVSDETTSILHVVQLPPLPEVPEPLRGRAFVTVEVAHVGTADEADRLMAPLRALGAEIDTLAPAAPVALSMLHMDPPHPVPGMGDHRLLGELPAEAIERFAAITGAGSGSPLITAEIRHLGGALGRTADGHGALAAVPGAYLVFGAGMVVDPDSAGAVREHLDRLVDAFEPYDAGYTYTNFVEHPTATAEAFDADTYERLRAVKAQLDPDDMFRVGRAIA
jgi:FAD/FMN-containing dehydrogenase